MQISKLTPKPKLANNFGVTTKTIDRWVDSEALDFPKPIKINSRCYFDDAEIEAWKAARLRKSMSEAA